MTRLHQEKLNDIQQAMLIFSKDTFPLKGISGENERQACAKQFVSSLRRVEYVKQLANRKLSPLRADPTSEFFDPLMAASLALRSGNTEEAWWLTFLATHFGKHSDDGWRLVRDFYGAFSKRPRWSWLAVSQNTHNFFQWLDTDWPTLVDDETSRRFSNHRKYESKSPKHIKSVIGSYIDLVMLYGGHSQLMIDAHKHVGQNPHSAFAELYKRMRAVNRFGRLGTFDFLAMLGKLGIAPIEPGRAYLAGATGPLRGARLFVCGDPTATMGPEQLEGILADLDATLNVGKQVMEDALCNWQKSPDHFVLFRG